VLELGCEGEVVAVMPPAMRPRNSSIETPLLLIQFKSGFDWLLASHQICKSFNYNSICSRKLPGGYVWGDRIRVVVDCLENPNSKRGLSLGVGGVVVGPGHTPGKIAVRFESDSGEWNIWPGVVCKDEECSVALLQNLVGGFRRGDRVRAAKAISAVVNSITILVQDGDEGFVLGPGHASGRLLVKFDSDGRTWSTTLAQISAVEPSAKVDGMKALVDADSHISSSSPDTDAMKAQFQ
jgi:hypothetical protein